MKVLHTKEDFLETTKLNGFQVYLFTTKWCGDCIFIKPQLPSIEQAFPEMMFYELDRDECIELAQDMEIMGIPSFVTYKDGKEVSRFVSSLRKTKEEIVEYLNKTHKEG